MSLRIYNTQTKNKETFVPLEENKVKMYVCGPTVYDTSHIGHARSVVIFDVIFRWLRHSGYDVCYVRNFTDVDDKIIKRANELGVEPTEISEKYIKEFHNEMDALNVLRPTMEPKATEHIQDIIDFIQLLVDKGKAYHVEGSDVFFSISSFEGYGKLSGRNPDDMMPGSRIAVDTKKRDPRDFTLWKPVKPGEPSWPSPWGDGRPGWHIECSAMSHRYLGESFDIHGGGKDLIFPHHENEVAQSEAAFGKDYVKYWIHNGFVDINNEKMSKSLGNFTMIKDVLKDYHAEVIRMFLLSKHYRSPIDYNDSSMDEVISGLDRLYAFLERAYAAGADKTVTDPGEAWAEFVQAMDDDFNTARGMATLFDTIKSGNRLLDKHEGKITDEVLGKVSTLCSDLKQMGDILGLLTQEPEEYFRVKKESGLADKALDAEAIDRLVNERIEARKSKDFARADEIRAELDAMNIMLEDGPEGTTWKIG
ncbi:MAG: cysteine--tRNA ligase [Desulfobacteraceae bacterium]|nr:cysteine--tRNA ligase [Desulfobacteraceae bacterium]